MNKLVQNFKEYISKETLFRPEHRLLVGVSGGLDSVVLCHLLKDAGFDFEIAHMNFQLRGEESTRDENFVIALAEELSIPYHLKNTSAEKHAAVNKSSIQLAARELRYNWFDELIDASRQTAKPLHFILTAHHGNDNAESVLMNIFRGTGLAGLKGILPARQLIRRPLLFAFREELENYAIDQKIAWVEDSSNASDKYARNFVRNRVIPVIAEQYPSLVNTINLAASHARETNLFFDKAMKDCLDKLVHLKGLEQMLPVKKWQQIPGKAAVLFAWLKSFGFSPAQMGEAVSLASSQTGHYIDSSTHRILRNRDWLVLTPLSNRLSDFILVEGNNGLASFGTNQLSWSTETFKGENIPMAADIAWLDTSKIRYPILLRSWKAGDYFYPLGMPKKKKVARFLIDAKLSRSEKEKIWVLESDRKIIWVIGHRIDDRFKVKSSTRNLLKLRLTSVT